MNAELVSRALYEALVAQASPMKAAGILELIEEPGTIAMRCRYRHLLDLSRRTPLPLPVSTHD